MDDFLGVSHIQRIKSHRGEMWKSTAEMCETKTSEPELIVHLCLFLL